MALIKCYNCGNFISDKAGQCPKCGASMTGVSQQQSPQQGAVSEQTILVGKPAIAAGQTNRVSTSGNWGSSPTPNTQKKSNKGIIIGLSAALFLLLAGLVFILIKNNQEEREAERKLAKLTAQHEQEKKQLKEKQVELAEKQREAEEAEKARQAEMEKERQRRMKAEAEAKAAERRENQRQKLKSFNGSYYFSGTVRNNLYSHAEYPFTISFTIDDGDVDGTFETESNSGPLRGSIDANGNMKLTEYNYDGTTTGYYFKGTFNGSKYKGSYGSTIRKCSMSFWTF